MVSTLVWQSYPRFIQFWEGMSGLWSSAEALHIDKISKTAMFNRRPMGSPILNIFKSKSFAVILPTRFFNIKTLLRDPYGRKRFPWLTFNIFRMLSERPVLFLYWLSWILAIVKTQKTSQAIFPNFHPGKGTFGYRHIKQLDRKFWNGIFWIILPKT